MQRTLLSVLALTVSLVVVSCNKATEDGSGAPGEKVVQEATDAATGDKVDVAVSNDTVSVKSRDGDFSIDSGGGAKVPDGFPADILVYKGAEVAMSAKQRNQFILHLTTADAPQKVVDAYKSFMTGKGWEEESAVDVGPQKMLSYTKEGRTASIQIGRDDEKTAIILGVEIAN